MSAKISILEGAHNAVIESGNKTEYFLDENYILTSFEPFILSALSTVQGFTADMTDEAAQDYYKLQSEGMDISFTSEGENYDTSIHHQPCGGQPQPHRRLQRSDPQALPGKGS
jgi:hypothetical protein